MNSDDDLLAQLGVEIPWPEPKRKPVKGEAVRHTAWSNSESFEFVGYVARVVQTTCECCGRMRENLEGVFTVEVKIGTGARRLQALAAKGNWPAGGGHTCEVRQEFTRWCPDCVRQLGFDQEVEAPGTGREVIIKG